MSYVLVSYLPFNAAYFVARLPSTRHSQLTQLFLQFSGHQVQTAYRKFCGQPYRMLTDDLVKVAVIPWMRAAHDRSTWKTLREAYAHLLSSVGRLKSEIMIMGTLNSNRLISSIQVGVINFLLNNLNKIIQITYHSKINPRKPLFHAQAHSSFNISISILYSTHVV